MITVQRITLVSILVCTHLMYASGESQDYITFKSTSALYTTYNRDEVTPVMDLLSELDAPTHVPALLTPYQKFVLQVRALPWDIQQQIYSIALHTLPLRNKTAIKNYIATSLDIWPGNGFWSCEQTLSFENFGTACCHIVDYKPIKTHAQMEDEVNYQELRHSIPTSRADLQHRIRVSDTPVHGQRTDAFSIHVDHCMSPTDDTITTQHYDWYITPTGTSYTSEYAAGASRQYVQPKKGT